MSASDPGVGSFAVSPSDTAVLEPSARSLFVEGAGSVRFRGLNGMIDTWEVADGAIIPVQIQQVFATGTDATGIHAIV